MEYTVRLAKTKEDLEGIINVQLLTWIDTYANPKYGLTEGAVRKYIEEGNKGKRFDDRYKSFKDENKRNWIALNTKSEVIAWLGASITGSGEGYFAIYVLPEYQRQGIGKALMEEYFTWFGKDRKVKIKVVVYNEKAIRFYESLGFCKTDKYEDLVMGNFVGKNLEVEMIKKL